MPLSWNEIRQNAVGFAQNWNDEKSERAEAQTFWNEFFAVFGLNRRRIAAFEKPAITASGTTGRIDLFWKGTLLVEHKSKGRDLEKAYHQGLDYFAGLKDSELPKYIIVSDFERFKLFDLDEGTEHFFVLEELPDKIHLFGFIAGYQQRKFRDEDPVNMQAAELMGKLHDALEEKGYKGHALEVLLTRLLFCLFADDTGIFEKSHFEYYIENHTASDGKDLGAKLVEIFDIADTPPNERQSDIHQDLSLFPYINGELFKEKFKTPYFSASAREMLLECCYFDWSRISPAIFGSLFQSAMNPDERRRLGAHYTSEKNILKVVSNLFLDELQTEFNKVKNNRHKLEDFHQKLAALTFFDPACGCGNFLIITYRELRKLEIEVLIAKARLDKNIDDSGNITGVLNIAVLSKLDVDALYGIEIEEFASRIAEVAIWLTDHQMNMQLSEAFGQYFVRLPLQKSPHIHNANALRTDWNTILNPQKCSYVLGNPPFVGSKLLSPEQRKDMELVFNDFEGEKVMDLVTAWYWKASKYIAEYKHVKIGFVSTNSVTQGEQVGYLWQNLLTKYGIKIHFAHRTFKWTNEARGKAAVYCVIIGFANFDSKNKKIYDYLTVTAEPNEFLAQNINPYLFDGPDTVILKRQKPICNVPEMNFGNMPLDGGNLLLDDEEKNDFLRKEPSAEKWIRPLISAKEYLNNQKRWCLWLIDCPPSELRKMKLVMERIENVKKFRENSVAPSTRIHAQTPALFRDKNNPETLILIPSTTSENRHYIPLGFFSNNEIANNSCHILPGGTLYHFAILISRMHMSWTHYVCGRLGGSYRYSKDLVYNNYPWPAQPDTKTTQKIESLAQAVLDARTRYPDSSLADLYDPLSMPADLRKAHTALDSAVDKLYQKDPFKDDADRIAHLFFSYQKLTAGLLADLVQPTPKKRRSKK